MSNISIDIKGRLTIELLELQEKRRQTESGAHKEDGVEKSYGHNAHSSD
jgi:hypothetical protein